MSILAVLVPLLIFLVILVGMVLFLTQKDVYDERQQVARGLAHRDGFFALVICFLLYVILLIWLEPGRQLSINLAMTALFCGMDVYLISCILRGAYIPINKNPKRSAGGWIAVFLMYLVLLFPNAEDFLQKGIESELWVQFLCMVEFGLIAVLSVVRIALDQREKEE